jgi:hypothetical protein
MVTRVLVRHCRDSRGYVGYWNYHCFAIVPADVTVLDFRDCLIRKACVPFASTQEHFGFLGYS